MSLNLRTESGMMLLTHKSKSALVGLSCDARSDLELDFICIMFQNYRTLLAAHKSHDL